MKPDSTPWSSYRGYKAEMIKMLGLISKGNGKIHWKVLEIFEFQTCELPLEVHENVFLIDLEEV